MRLASRLALLLALAVFGAPAHGQTRGAPAKRPAAAAPAAPPAGFVPSRLSGDPARAVLLVGMERADGESGLKLRADLERDLVALSPRARFGLVLSVGWFHDSADEEVVEGELTTRTEATTDRLELVPSFRATLAASPTVDLYAEGGLGATYLFTEGEVTTEQGGLSETARSSGSGPGAVLRFAAGLRVAATPSLRLGVEALGVNFHYGEARGRTITVLGTAAYRL